MTGESSDINRPKKRSQITAWVQNVLGSLIASTLFILFFQNIVQKSSYAFVAFAGSISRSWEDKWYYQAVVVSTNSIIFEGFRTILSMIAGIVIAVTIITITSYHMSVIKRNTDKDPVILKIIQRPPGWVWTTMLIVPALMLNASIFAQTSGWFLSVQASASFDRRLLSLSGVASDSERNSLIREWSFVQGKADYNAVMTHMDDIARIHKVKIPQRFI